MIEFLVLACLAIWIASIAIYFAFRKTDDTEADYLRGSLHQWSEGELAQWVALLEMRAKRHRKPGSKGQKLDELHAKNYRKELQKREKGL